MSLLTRKSKTTSRTEEDGWHLGNGDEIVPGRTAVKLLGGGRRFEAYLAYDDTLLTTVVVKMLRPSRINDAIALEGLAEESAALRACNHPSLCRGFDAVLDGPRPHIVLEHVEGPRLSTLIRRFGRVDLDQLVPLAVEVCAALHYLHSRDLVHLDVKPQNIIMSAPPRLIDLSVACTTADALSLKTAVGTDAYMAPEQANPASATRIGPAADVWGLGATLYESVSGALPYPRPSDDDRHPQLHVRATPLPDDVPAGVCDPIMACLEQDPADRPSPRDLARSLEPLVEALPRRIVLGRIRPRWS